MTTKNTETPQHRWQRLTIVCLSLTGISLLLIILTQQAEPAPVGDMRGFARTTIAPLCYGGGISAFGVLAMLTFYYGLEWLYSIRSLHRRDRLQ